jgi:SAM-dependent methyltransferase
MQDDLAKIAKQWESHGKTDPRWAVLSDNDKRGGLWDDASFYATGRAQIAESLDLVRAAGAVPVRRDRALDFGCGVGRLATALAEHFDRVDGVDIAPSMIAEAVAGNRFPGRVEYHVNVADDLALFPTDSFDLVHSFITLQHIPAPLVRRYVREFVRVAAPGGTIVFQAPHRTHHPGWKHYVDKSFPRLAMLYRKFRYGAATRNDVYAHDAAEIVDTLTAAGATVARVHAGRERDCPGWLSALYIARKGA